MVCLEPNSGPGFVPTSVVCERVKYKGPTFSLVTQGAFPPNPLISLGTVPETPFYYMTPFDLPALQAHLKQDK